MKRMIFRKSMMRAAMLALCTTMLGTVPMLAQDNSAPPPPPTDQAGPPMGGHGRMGGHQLEMLTKKLNLTPDQVTQVKAIDDDTMKQAMAVRDDTTLAQADKRGKMMEIHKAAQDKIRAVLNDEQKTKYDAMVAQRQERRQNREGGPPPPPSAAPQK
jgi:protein CpxP